MRYFRAKILFSISLTTQLALLRYLRLVASSEMVVHVYELLDILKGTVTKFGLESKVIDSVRTTASVLQGQSFDVMMSCHIW
ncbi:3513_t:CDS:1, partial [Acaulospora morrowiae]